MTRKYKINPALAEEMSRIFELAGYLAYVTMKELPDGDDMQKAFASTGMSCGIIYATLKLMAEDPDFHEKPSESK